MGNGDLLSLYGRQKKSYYNISINAKDLFCGKDAPQKCREFIDAHFEKGHKGDVLLIPNSYKADYDSFGKHVHTVSLFLLGLSLSSFFDCALKTKLNALLLGENIWYDYTYSWYLACIYHDVASCIENGRTDDYTFEKVNDSRLFLTDQALRRFSKETVVSYLEYRRKALKNDHGIIAGIELYDALRDSFDKHTKNVDWSQQQEYYQNGLCWRKAHIPHFAYIADAVCCHNIWMAYRPDICKMEDYRNNGLSELVIETKEDRLSLKGYPLQFILCLLDTIEPVKRFTDLTPQVVLENIYLRQEPYAFYLLWTDLIKGQPQFFKWVESIIGLSDWMNVEVDGCSRKHNRCGIRIKITDLVGKCLP